MQEMQVEVNGLQSQLNYMLDVVDKCRANKMTGRLSASLADNVTSAIERHGKLQTDIGDTLSQIELAQNNVDDFEVSCSRLHRSDKSVLRNVLTKGAFHWDIRRPTTNRRLTKRVWAAHGSPAGDQKAPGSIAPMRSGCI